MVLNPPLKSTGAGRWLKKDGITLSRHIFQMAALQKNIESVFWAKELLRM